MFLGKKILLGIFLFAALAFADVNFYSQDTLAFDTTSQKNFQRYSAVPVLGYTEETLMQLGAMILFFLKPDEVGGKLGKSITPIPLIGYQRKSFGYFGRGDLYGRPFLILLKISYMHLQRTAYHFFSVKIQRLKPNPRSTNIF